jgi:outer membrane lipoprotein-sorting protein
MMKILTRVLALSLILALPLALPAKAETDPEVAKWLDKLTGLQGAGAYSFDFTGSTTMQQMGQVITMQMQGSQTQADAKRMHTDMTMTMELPGMGPMEMTMVMVGDGETIWMEVENPMMGGRQVMKLAADKVAAFAEASGGGAPGGQQPGEGPLEQVQRMVEKFDMQLVGIADGAVTLRADIDGETAAGMMPGMGDKVKELVVVLDETTGFPREMRMGGDEPIIVMNFTNYRPVAEDALDASLFTYTPPEGSPVMDLGAMMEAMSAGGE